MRLLRLNCCRLQHSVAEQTRSRRTATGPSDATLRMIKETHMLGRASMLNASEVHPTDSPGMDERNIVASPSEDHDLQLPCARI